MENSLTINPMNANEARECIEQINANLTDIRGLLLDLYERQGWKALGYDNWKACVTSEFKYKQSYLYYQLEAAKAERNLQDLQDSAIVENKIPESQLRPLTHLAPDQQRIVWQKAVETAPEGKMTAKHVESVKFWIIRNQLARRNLPPQERVRLALLLKPANERKLTKRFLLDFLP